MVVLVLLGIEVGRGFRSPPFIHPQRAGRPAEGTLDLRIGVNSKISFPFLR